MGKDGVLTVQREHKPLMAGRFGGVVPTLFGSIARGAAPAGRDVDLLVRFDSPTTPRRCFGVQPIRKTFRGVRPIRRPTRHCNPASRPSVEREAIHV